MPLFTIKHATNFVSFMLETQKNMYQFHTHEALDFHNIYVSKWWTWPLVLRKAELYFLLLAIAAQYIPYIFINRLSYIYYFYSVLPFLGNFKRN